jgi:hypothetical protein
MIQRWDLLTFLHWSYDIDAVQRLLPPGLTVDAYGGRAWVGLVPFLMEVRAPWGPAVPWISRFCETNVRTYATAADGTRGVWFLSLDAARLPAVVTARTSYRLPYFWSRMGLQQDPATDTYRYTCARRWPGRRRARSMVHVRLREDYAAHELTEFDHFLTARWRLYSPHPGGLRYVLAAHAPWQLRRAEVLEVGDELLGAAGLAPPQGDPIVHWSPGTEVRIGLPARVPPA